MAVEPAVKAGKISLEEELAPKIKKQTDALQLIYIDKRPKYGHCTTLPQKQVTTALSRSLSVFMMYPAHIGKAKSVILERSLKRQIQEYSYL
jgi:hypothetical protein